MRIDWRQVSHIGAAIVGTIVPGVAKAEQLAWTIGGLSGRDKQNTVVELVKQALDAAGTVTERHLANDADVETATRAVIDAVVALQAIIAKKAAAPAAR